MNIYYVDSVSGNDSFDGLSPEKAIATTQKAGELNLLPGDKLLFHCGQTFEGVLDITACGTPENPIIVSTYGSGGKPEIKAKSADHAVGILGDGIEINGLSITNTDGGKLGILVRYANTGAAKHIYISNCHIHDVLYTSHESHETGGITVVTSREAPSWYEDFRIENNHIINVERSGIFFSGFWYNRYGALNWCCNDYIDDEHGWYPHKDIYVAGNLIEYPGGDGIVVIGAIKPLIEHNRVFHANWHAENKGASAGIWPMSCNGAVVQYNEVAYTHHPRGGDGMAYDVDQCSRDTIVQYNYSHHNEGGFLLICNFIKNEEGRYISHHNTIVRNNVSINDATLDNRPIFTIVGCFKDVFIENNTIYKDDDNRFKMVELSDYSGLETFPRNVNFTNNLFFMKNPNGWNHFRGDGTATFDTNVFYGITLPHETEYVKVKNCLQYLPVVDKPGNASNGRNTARCYIPQWHSRLTQDGIKTASSADKDFFGRPTEDKTYIGAFIHTKEDDRDELRGFFPG